MGVLGYIQKVSEEVRQAEKKDREQGAGSQGRERGYEGGIAREIEVRNLGESGVVGFQSSGRRKVRTRRAGRT
eukprot:3152335-Lingulodinium_polyedra.AAC.1